MRYQSTLNAIIGEVPEVSEIILRGDLKIKYGEFFENSISPDTWGFWYGLYVGDNKIWMDQQVSSVDENFTEPSQEFIRECAKIGVSKWLKAAAEIALGP